MKSSKIIKKLNSHNKKIKDSFRKVRKIESRWYRLKNRTTLKALDILAEWLAAHVERIGAKGCVLGVSGGVDSSLVALLLHKSRIKNISALILPNNSDPQDAKDAKTLLKALKISYRVIDIAPIVETTVKSMGKIKKSQQSMVTGNLASRVRQALFFYEANRNGMLVIGTGNFDETYIGYGCKGGGSDMSPITGLHKHEVRALLKAGLELVAPKIAERLSIKPASPGYWAGQNAEDEIGMTYKNIAAVLDILIGQCCVSEEGIIPWNKKEFGQLIEDSSISEKDFLKVVNLVQNNYHKFFSSPSLWRKEPYQSSEAE